jgi:hypothetical protein
MNRVFNKMDEKTILVFIHVENICNFLKWKPKTFKINILCAKMHFDK